MKMHNFTIRGNCLEIVGRIERRGNKPVTVYDLEFPCGMDNLSLTELMEAISRLNFEERQVIVLGFIMGYTGRELREMTGWPQGTITSKQTKNRRPLWIRINKKYLKL